jgi:hypothetical protein
MVVAPVGLGHDLVPRQAQGLFDFRRTPSSAPAVQNRPEKNVNADLRGGTDRFD